MKFSLSKASIYNTEEEKEKYEKLGFKFEWLPEENRWSDMYSTPSFEIETLEGLLQFIKTYGAIILEWEGDPELFSILIYDDYLD